ncbi:hypothetical protein F4677DRAFT_449986 [Hypoxylon crocopeplum]|nr:hypothetical protein F4677DRAFT_449986 [Hypoxylon crocopeplum]
MPILQPSATQAKSNEFYERLFAVLEAIEDDFLPSLSSKYSQAVAIFAFTWWWVGPQIAAAWDQVIQWAEVYEGNNPFSRGLAGAIKMAAFFFSLFRLDDLGVAELVARITKLQDTIEQERHQHEEDFEEECKKHRTSLEKECDQLKNTIEKEHHQYEKAIIEKEPEYKTTKDTFTILLRDNIASSNLIEAHVEGIQAAMEELGVEVAHQLGNE